VLLREWGEERKMDEERSMGWSGRGEGKWEGKRQWKEQIKGT